MYIYILFVIQNNTNFIVLITQVTLLSPTCTISIRLVIIFNFIFAIRASDKKDNFHSFCRTIKRIVFIFLFHDDSLAIGATLTKSNKVKETFSIYNEL